MCMCINWYDGMIELIKSCMRNSIFSIIVYLKSINHWQFMNMTLSQLEQPWFRISLVALCLFHYPSLCVVYDEIHEFIWTWVDALWWKYILKRKYCSINCALRISLCLNHVIEAWFSSERCVPMDKLLAIFAKNQTSLAHSCVCNNNKLQIRHFSVTFGIRFHHSQFRTFRCEEEEKMWRTKSFKIYRVPTIKITKLIELYFHHCFRRRRFFSLL